MQQVLAKAQQGRQIIGFDAQLLRGQAIKKCQVALVEILKRQEDSLSSKHLASILRKWRTGKEAKKIQSTRSPLDIARKVTTLLTSLLEELTLLGQATSVELMTQASPAQDLSAIKGEQLPVPYSGVRPSDS